MKTISLDEFYQELTVALDSPPGALLPDGIQQEIGHFNVFDVADLFRRVREKPPMLYDRRAYYKISLISGRSRAEYADKAIDIERHALLFATPKVPYNWEPLDQQQAGHFCVFTEEFLLPAKSGVVLEELPLFRAGGCPVFPVTDEDVAELEAIFRKMHKEIAGGYAYKYDLLRTYVLELLHFGQKLQPASALHLSHTAAARVAALFVELLERQFPIETPQQKLQLRTAKDYADRLAVHVNHLNRVLKETTGYTTTEIIGSRVTQEAKLLLKQTRWNISEISDSLGFAEVAHFSNFFKRQTALSPANFRGQG
ncbi:helix-turn-helix domain-containing protein [Hymenobacter sp. PAMC 26628]|uniref:helix-turn-helix domain-containing protein n=1 Tax=Hymenobacter sp. PAMC 26628 TaxID=1484118 RepID=UPI000770227B|nr:helix-turn-helix transcriptional regulator [Hymenobacter sp. PAMC 26628]AMJ67756.1 transcriptional regulator [Hymenobacter sp. PAMC 26628]